MAIETTKWDIVDFLTDDIAIAAYLDAVLAEGDPDEMRDALAHVTRAKGSKEDLNGRAWSDRL